MRFFTLRAKSLPAKLRQAFIKISILYQFDFEDYIWLETDVSSYAILGVLCQLIWNDLGRWYHVIFFSWKMIMEKTQYKTDNDKLLAIVEASKTWRHYLEDCKYEILIFTNHNNPYHFINIKIPSFRQVW